MEKGLPTYSSERPSCKEDAQTLSNPFLMKNKEGKELIVYPQKLFERQVKEYGSDAEKLILDIAQKENLLCHNKQKNDLTYNYRCFSAKGTFESSKPTSEMDRGYAFYVDELKKWVSNKCS